MTNFTYASIVPLIGGETLAMQNIFHKKPEYLMTFDGFQANESHLLNYYSNSVEYINLDEEQIPALRSVDVVNAVCPCGGLSSLNAAPSADSNTNKWLYASAKHVLEEVRPLVFWGENAPRLASKMGQPVVERLRSIGEAAGYTFSLYRTKSLFHGIPQVRERSFYFFWKGNEIPILDYYHRDYKTLDQLFDSVKREDDEMDEVVRAAIPSKNPYYQFVFEVLYPGLKFQNLRALLPDRSPTVFDIIEKSTDYSKVAAWMRAEGHDKEADKCDYRYDKLASGRNIMRGELIFPSKYIGAFVGQVPTALIHPKEDRHITYREALAIMGMPSDFHLLNPKRSLNHICQNVPVGTATDMSREVLAHLKGERKTVKAKYLYQSNHKRKHEVKDVETRTLEAFM